ncbi:hypothetical protein D3C76_1195310 [compost metagenome]
MPRLEFMIPGLSGSSVYTCGSVMKAPPSIGQCCICGKSDICISWAVTGRRLNPFIGSAFKAANPVPTLLNGFLSADNGLLRRAIMFCVLFQVFRNINWLRSIVPNRLDTARNLEPFTRSNNKAGPPASYTLR